MAFQLVRPVRASTVASNTTHVATVRSNVRNYELRTQSVPAWNVKFWNRRVQPELQGVRSLLVLYPEFFL